MSKAKRLRLASRITWGIGCILTFYFIVPNPELSLSTIIIAGFVVGIQYVFTQIESLPFEDGVLTLELNARNLFMWGFCLFIIFLDVIINLGGINKFMVWVRQSDSADVLYGYGVTDQQLDGLTKVFNFVLSVVSVLASEFLYSYADTLDNNRKGNRNKPNIKEHNGS